MLRGAIDRCTAEEVEGWIVSGELDLRDRPVMAFLGERCVGVGAITKFRQDLLDVGLGDGHAGFHFDITLDRPEDRGAVVVKIDGSDFVLPQRAHGGDAFDPRHATLTELYDSEAIEWMRARGWLSAAQFDAVRTLARFGIYDRSLVRSPGAGQRSVARDEEASGEVADLLGLLGFRMVTPRHAEVEVGGLAAFLDGAGLDVPVVAVRAGSPGRVMVVEGSHRAVHGDGTFAAAVEYRYGNDRLLFLDTRCQFRFEADSRASLRITFA